MKKVLFFAAVLAVASMTFVACGKKENKEAEKENKEAVDEQKELSRAEQATRAIEAASSVEEIYNIAAEYQDLTDDDFTPAQQERIEKKWQELLAGAYGDVKEAPAYDEEVEDWE